MAYPFRQMTTQELKKRSQDNRNKKRLRKLEQDRCSINELKARRKTVTAAASYKTKDSF